MFHLDRWPWFQHPEHLVNSNYCAPYCAIFSNSQIIFHALSATLSTAQRGRGENFRRYFGEGQADIFGWLCGRNTFYLLSAYLTPISIAPSTHSRMIQLFVSKKLEIMWKEEVVAQLEAGFRNFLRRLRATTRCLRHDNRFPGRDLNPGPPEFYVTMLPTSLRSSVTLKGTREY